MKRSGIITLLTDFGLIDPYVAMMKGVILSINPDVRIVDISHCIKAGSIKEASGILHETFPFFPEGTIHVAVIDPGVGSSRRQIGIDAGGHLFVGPDNGIFWPVIEDHREAKIISLTENKYFMHPVTRTFHGRDVFAPVASHLSLGEDLSQMGKVIGDPVELSIQIPHIVDGVLYGQVVKVDNFGNLVTNICRQDLDHFLKDAKLHIRIGSLVIKKINDTYSDGNKGEVLALINSSDRLEIAVNLGRASEHMATNPGEIPGTEVRIEKL